MTYSKPAVTPTASAAAAIQKSPQDKNIEHMLDSDGVTRNATPNAYEADE